MTWPKPSEFGTGSAAKRPYSEPAKPLCGEPEIRERFFATRDAAAALERRTEWVDFLVRERWGAYFGQRREAVALAAVGGYGRRELFPASDVDLLFLTADWKTQAAIGERLALFLRDLWDEGLRISQSVHTPGECNRIDDANAELAVSLLDRRFLGGEEALFAQVRTPPRDLSANIARLTRERHARFQNTIYHLEPNVKDAPGGLRDLQALRWFAQLGAGDPVSLRAEDLGVLFELRCFLHYLSGRDNNKLSFERQDEIAALSGGISPEKLMRRYYRAVRSIARRADPRKEPPALASPMKPSQRPVWPAFRAILARPGALRALHETGELEEIFPELREIEALVIRDFYHRYTVDEHTLVAIDNLFELRHRGGDIFGELANETEDLELLVAALLFHDVGKSEPGESHVRVSRRVAEGALKRAGISEREWSLVAFLIEAHLEMSSTMTGRDPDDPATIREMALKVGTVEKLRLLTLMTWADISAVNPAAMTPYRSQLLRKLYARTYEELTRELGARLHKPEADVGPELAQFLEGLPPRYLRTHSAEEMAGHLRLERECGHGGVSVALVRATAWQLTVVAGDRPYLFASVAAALSGFGFNILKAEAFSNARGTVIDTFTFADPARNLEQNPTDGEELKDAVRRAARGEITAKELFGRRSRFRPDARAQAASRVSVDNQASASATLIQIVAQDRPGLLYDVASVISRRGGNIEVVLVDTEARKAIDVFYVTQAGERLPGEEAEALAGAIRAVLNPASRPGLREPV